MSLAESKKQRVENILKQSLRNKFANYRPETKYMPFHHHLLGKDRMALYSFIQSLNTTFGTSFYEPVAIALATDRFKIAANQMRVYNKICSTAHACIQTIMDDLTTARRKPDKLREIDEIRQVCQNPPLIKVKLTKVDIWLQSDDGTLFLIDMKTVKPNIGDFKSYKRNLLEWTAAEMARNPSVQINTIIAIPYNPYHPQPYERWTLQGIFDLSHELLVGEELWDFIGGPGTYQDLLDCFERVGIELRPEIDRYFQNFR
jgi:type II restriction enzyme